MSAALRLVECWEKLGCAANDPFRAVWDDVASMKDRRLLLAMAGAQAPSAAALGNKSWGELNPAMRGDIKRGLERFKGWAERLESAAKLEAKA